jgi:monoamine oxidase
MQRRDFIKSTGFIALGSFLSSYQNFDIPKLSRNESVLVLGGGMAGLTAAYRLIQKGFSVKVLEARNRLGGRILTYSFPENPEIYAEMGGEWIGESHVRVQNLCKELQLTLNSHRFPSDWWLNDTYYPFDKAPTDRAWDEKLAQIFTEFRKLPLKEQKKFDKLSWWRFLINQGIPETSLLMRELNDSTDFGENIREVSAFAAISEYASSNSFNEMDFRVQGGNSEIIKALARKIGSENILLNKKVKKIHQERKKVNVFCEDTSVFEAHKIICTLPTFAISQIEWLPTMPLQKKMALEQLQYSRIIKIQVLFKERFWKRDDFSINTDSSAHYIFHTTQKQAHTKGILSAYIVGDKAYLMGRMQKNKQVSFILDALKPIFGDVSPLVEQIASYYWGNDRFSQGAYAIYDVEQWFHLKDVLAEPFKNTLFAGEHIGDWQGFMEGAIQTAQDVVEIISP